MKRASDPLAFVENECRPMCPLHDDRNDGAIRFLRDANEAGALSQNDAIAIAREAISFEVATRINKRFCAAPQNAQRILRTSAHRAESLDQSTERRELPHDEVVCQWIERSIDAECFPQRRQRADEIGTRDTAVVIRNEKRGLVLHLFDLLDPIAAKAQVVPVHRAEEREHGADRLRVALVESIRIECHRRFQRAMTMRKNQPHPLRELTEIWSRQIGRA